ncbi:Uncharacterised protein [Enterobacter hormaechei]|nr:Uncharacterised protein [Enterobacter hormaechei]SAF22194.1 Uncharacterised protein [Enterobacter hormaechei]
MLHHLIAHIVIAVFDDEFNIAIRMQPLADLFRDLHHLTLARFKGLAVEIADNIVHLRAVHGPLDAGQMIKTLIPFRHLRALFGGHFRMNTRSQRQRIHHHPFRRPRMNVIPDDFDRHRCRVKVFILQFTHAATVDGVGPLRVKRLNVKVFCAFSNLFIRREGHADIAMRDIFALQHRQRRHDLGDARFVISPQQGFAVSGD